jgi:4-amino-4-deoxy-L-arabinose transferase-like glycosyltransferase
MNSVRAMPRDRFWRVLLLIVAVAFAVRVGYVAIAKRGPCPLVINGQKIGEYHSECTGFRNVPSDQVFYNAEANTIAKGYAFTAPFPKASQPGVAHPATAEHPPLTVMVLAPVSWLFDHPPLRSLADGSKLTTGTTLYTHVREQRYFMAILGTLLVLLIGLLGRAIGGEAVGLVAAALAAVYPNLWVNDGLIMSETITGLTVVGLLLVAVRFARRPSWPDALGLGVLSGLAILSRAELALFVPLLVIPITLLIRGPRLAQRVQYAIGACVCAALVLAPWVVYNQARFTKTTFISTNDGTALAGSYCDAVFHGSAIGLWSIAPPCLDDPAPIGDESVIEKIYRKKAFTYLKGHEKRLPVVVAARVGRTWSLFRPVDMIGYNQGEGRERWVGAAGLWMYYPLLAGSIAGAFLLARRSRWSLWMLLVPAIATTLIVAATYGQVRFRAATEPTLVLLTAITLTALWERLRTPASTSPVAVTAETRTDATVGSRVEPEPL